MNSEKQGLFLNSLRLARIFRVVGLLLVLFAAMAIAGSFVDPAKFADKVGADVLSVLIGSVGMLVVIRNGRKVSRLRSTKATTVAFQVPRSSTPGTAAWRLRTLFQWAFLTPAGAASTLCAIVVTVKFPSAHQAPIIFYSAAAARKVFSQETSAQQAAVSKLKSMNLAGMSLASGESEPTQPGPAQHSNPPTSE